MMGLGMGVGLLLLLVFWGLLIAGAAWLAKVVFLGRNKPTAGARLKPLEILDQRYARGEISEEDYQAIRQDLSR